MRQNHMTRVLTNPIRNSIYCTMFALAAVSNLALAQDTPPADQPPQQSQAPGGWRRASDPPPNQPGYPSYSQNTNPAQNQEPPNGPPPYAPPPAQLTIKPGTFVTVRINQALSSDRNQTGDAFSATLERPIVVDGVVVAQRGQMVAGRVAEAKKAGRVEGVSRLGVQLTDLT